MRQILIKEGRRPKGQVGWLVFLTAGFAGIEGVDRGPRIANNKTELVAIIRKLVDRPTDEDLTSREPANIHLAEDGGNPDKGE